MGKSQRKRAADWPDWWTWDLEIGPHVMKRMIDRRFTEADLRSMLEDAHSVEPDVEVGRFLIKTKLGRRAWEVIIEPDQRARALAVVTAYAVEGGRHAR